MAGSANGLTEDQLRDIGRKSAGRTLSDFRAFIRYQIPDEKKAQKEYQEGAFMAASLGRWNNAQTLSSIANDEKRHHELLEAIDLDLQKIGVEAPEQSGYRAYVDNPNLSDADVAKIARASADEVMDRVYGVTDLTAHIMEHEIMGGARVIDRYKAENPDIPCKCFEFEDETYCWKPGLLGLISSKKNPEQLSSCKIRIPASPGARERFKKIKGAVGEASEEHRKQGGGLEDWMTKVGEKMAEKGVEL
jgi:hypothetical protein